MDALTLAVPTPAPLGIIGDDTLALGREGKERLRRALEMKGMGKAWIKDMEGIEFCAVARLEMLLKGLGIVGDGWED